MSITKLIFEIYDNIVKINDKKIIVLSDKSKNIWFSLPHLLKALEYSTYRDEIKTIGNIVDNTDISTYEKILNNSNIKPNHTVHPYTKMISEGGLYLLLSKSKKPLAISLKEELYTKVLPDIRKYGKFQVNNIEKKKLDKINDKITAKIHKQTQIIKNLKTEIKFTKKHLYPNNTTGNGFIYIIELKTPYNGKITKCYKIGYTANLEKRMSTYKTGNPNINLIYHENINCNRKQLEKCIVNLNHLKLLKHKTEIICDTNIHQLINEIKDCKKLLHKYSN